MAWVINGVFKNEGMGRKVFQPYPVLSFGIGMSVTNLKAKKF